MIMVVIEMENGKEIELELYPDVAPISCENFEKLVYLFESYFKMGGTHFQLTYVSKEDLINAKKTPDKYKNLRVRVSGFSDYFVFLNEGLQDEIIQRTTQTR